MNDKAIQIHQLGKLYHIGQEQADSEDLSAQILDALTSPVRKMIKVARGQSLSAAGLDKTFWALKDINLEIKRGEVVGIIGPNGAGKSTLLKILSRITEPTEGYADIYGRVGSLLEVGTGFHQDLTGRENIFLNGAILGMRKAEVQAKFRDIVAFSGVEEFIDTPVKHYSTGMSVRLAFAVAAHLDTDVLLVDEVLAVGDAEFQRRCLGKMSEVARSGRTVLFVTHNLSLVLALCQRGVLVRAGRIAKDGPIEEVVTSYISEMEQLTNAPIAERLDRTGAGRVRLVDVRATNGTTESTALQTGNPVRFSFEVTAVYPGIHIAFAIRDFLGRQITNFRSVHMSSMDVFDRELECTFICEIDELFLIPGTYRLDVSVQIGREVQDFIEAAMVLEVFEGTVRGRPVHPLAKGPVVLPHRWFIPQDN